MIIDAYTHYTTLNYLETMKAFPGEQAKNMVSFMTSLSQRHPHFSDVGLRVKDLDKYGIDKQVTMVQPIIEPNLFVNGEALLRSCRMVNDSLARVEKESGGRIVSLGVAPLALGDGGADRDEMRRAIHDLGLKGFMVMTNVHGGTPIDKYTSFWQEAGRLNTTVYVHPADPFDTRSRPYEDEFDMIHVLGWPYESTLALSRIVFKGILEMNPGLKVVAHHLGGMIPFFAGRISESYDKTASPPKPDQIAKISAQKPIMDSFKEIYYDTAVGGSKPALRCGYEVFGPKHLVYSTDYPWGPQGGRIRLATYANNIREMEIPESEKEEILGGNIQGVLKI